MTLVSYLFATGPEGATLTNANTGANTTALGAGGTGVFAAAYAGNGSAFGAKYTNALNLACIQRFLPAAANLQMAFEGVVTLPTAASNNPVGLVKFRNTGDVTVLSVLQRVNGNIDIQDNAGVFTTVATAAQLTAAGLGFGSKIRLSLVLTIATTTTGVVHAKVYTANGTTAVASLDLTNANLTALALAKGDFGISSNNNNAGSVVGWADLQFNDGGTSPIGPYVAANAAPIPDASADFTVDPNVAGTFTLTGSATDPDGTIASYVWDDITGTPTTVPGSGATRTVTIPTSTSGSTRTYRLTVTDNGGAVSTDTVVVTVLPHTRWLFTSGGLIPIRRAL